MNTATKNATALNVTGHHIADSVTKRQCSEFRRMQDSFKGLCPAPVSILLEVLYGESVYVYFEAVNDSPYVCEVADKFGFSLVDRGGLWQHLFENEDFQDYAVSQLLLEKQDSAAA